MAIAHASRALLHRLSSVVKVKGGTEMHLVYMDESGDEKWRTFAALTVPEQEWHATLAMIRDFRCKLHKTDGINVKAEFHACDFVKGRGDLGGLVSKWRRAQIFNETLTLITQLPGVRVFTASDQKSYSDWLLERLLNRLNVAMTRWDSRALFMPDDGHDEYRSSFRRLSTYNYIPSRYGTWDTTKLQRAKNIPLDRFIEDAMFKQSDSSYFIQLCDFVAYALLQKERPRDIAVARGLNESFAILRPVCQTEANPKDTFGTIRIIQPGGGRAEGLQMNSTAKQA